MEFGDWGWLAGLVGVLVLLVVAMASSRQGRRASMKGKASDPTLVPESDAPEALFVDVWVPVTAETASLRRLLDEGNNAAVVVDPGPGVWTLDAALLASRHRGAQDALADRLEELASIAGKDTGAVTVWLGQPPVATALDALRPAHCQPFRPVPARRG